MKIITSLFLVINIISCKTDSNNIEQKSDKKINNSQEILVERSTHMNLDSISADSLYKLGINILQSDLPENEYKEGFDYLIEAANQNHSEALAYLGMYKLEGRNIERNEQEGLMLLEKADKLGNVFAMYTLAHYYLSRHNGQKGISYLEKALKYKNDYIQYDLGYIKVYGYELGRPDYKYSNQININEGINLFKLSADQGFFDAQKELGFLYLYGNKVERNDSLAKYYINLALNNEDINNIPGGYDAISMNIESFIGKDWESWLKE